jgi:hypothetical protein
LPVKARNGVYQKAKHTNTFMKNIKENTAVSYKKKAGVPFLQQHPR